MHDLLARRALFAFVFLVRAVALALLLVVAVAGVAGAADGTRVVAVTVTFTALSLYIAPFLPLLTALVTQWTAAGWIKVGVTAALAVITTLVTTAIDKSVDLVLTWDSVLRVATAFGVAMLSYFVFRKPVIEPIAKKTADTGIG
jgi:hypothetical protein